MRGFSRSSLSARFVGLGLLGCSPERGFVGARRPGSVAWRFPAVLASAFADAGGRSRALSAGCLVLAVGSARIYVGAHLPLDVAGGIFLGIAVDEARPALLAPVSVQRLV